MELTRQEESIGTVIRVGKDLTIYQVASLRDELISELEKNERLVLPLDEVETCDAAGIQLLCSARKTADAAGKFVGICMPSSAVLDVIKELGSNVEDLLDSEI